MSAGSLLLDFIPTFISRLAWFLSFSQDAFYYFANSLAEIKKIPHIDDYIHVPAGIDNVLQMVSSYPSLPDWIPELADHLKFISGGLVGKLEKSGSRTYKMVPLVITCYPTTAFCDTCIQRP